MSIKINVFDEYNKLSSIYDFSEKNSLLFLNNLKNIDENINKNLEVKNFKLLGPELRAIVPDEVYSYIEFTSERKYTIWHKEMNTPDLVLKEQINECIWYSAIILMINEQHKFILDAIAPYTISQPNSMFPFHPLNNLNSDDLAHYKNICFKISQHILK